MLPWPGCSGGRWARGVSALVVLLELADPASELAAEVAELSGAKDDETIPRMSTGWVDWRSPSNTSHIFAWIVGVREVLRGQVGTTC